MFMLSHRNQRKNSNHHHRRIYAPPPASSPSASILQGSQYSFSPLVYGTYIYALYAWDEALETLYHYVYWLESRVIKTSEMTPTQELHIIRTHHLYHSLNVNTQPGPPLPFLPYPEVPNFL